MKGRRIVFHRPAQWRAGVLLGCVAREVLRPTSGLRVDRVLAATGATPVAITECGTIHVPREKGTAPLDERAPVPGYPDDVRLRSSHTGPWRLDLAPTTLRRIAPSGQIVGEWSLARPRADVKPLDFCVIDDTVYILWPDDIVVFDPRRATQTPHPHRVEGAKAIAATRTHVFVSGARGLVRFERERLCDGGTTTTCPAGPGPDRIAPWCGVIVGVVVAGNELRLLRYDADGSFVADQLLHPRDAAPGPTPTALHLDAGAGGWVVVSSGDALHVLVPATIGAEAGSFARFVTPTLDRGLASGERWDRVELDVRIPMGCALEVRHALGTDAGERDAFDAILRERGATAEHRLARIEQLLPATRWRVDRFENEGDARDVSRCDVLLDSPDPGPGRPTPRFLWIELRLVTTAGGDASSVQRMVVRYPRRSYSGHLPAHYRRPEAGADFVERLLAIHEVLFEGIDERIAGLWRDFDPRHVPAGFLGWIGGWLDLTLDEQWPADARRQLLSSAFRLFERKGTIAALGHALRIVVPRARVVDTQTIAAPMVLTNDGSGPRPELRIGRGMVLFSDDPERVQPQNAVLGIGTLLGPIVLGQDAAPSQAFDPLLRYAHGITVFLPFAGRELAARIESMRSLVDAFAPAHARIAYAALPHVDRIACGAYLGISARLIDARLARLDPGVAIGSAIVGGDPRSGPRLGRPHAFHPTEDTR